MEWEKNPKTEDKDLKELLAERFGSSNPSLDHKLFEWKVPLLERVKARLKEAFEKKEFIQVVADYDCDGVMSAAEFELIFRFFKHEKYDIRIPHRMSEGYGLSSHIVDEIKEKPVGLLILVDNGISCANEVATLKELGWSSIIMDHHLAPEDGILPEADILVDPAAFHEQADFTQYCGAGLVYKLAEIITTDKYTLSKIRACAAIATVADAVPLIDEEKKTYDNWLIVREGMKNCLDSKMITQGLYCLLRAAGCERKIDEVDVGFKIAPLINAPGRLYDDGAEKAFNLVISDASKLSEYDRQANMLVAVNNMRKQIVNDTIDLVRPKVKVESNVLCVYTPTRTNEGILGLIAAKLAEEKRVTTIVLTYSEETKKLKGSARAWGSFDVKEFLDQVSSELARYGGHKGAAGLTVEIRDGESPEDAFRRFAKRTNEVAGSYKYVEPSIIYDIEIKPSEAKNVLAMEEIYAPFGQGNPALIYKTSCKLQNRNGTNHAFMGATKKSIKLYTANFDAVNFTGEGKERFINAYLPDKVTLIGTFGWNEFAGRKYLQMIFKDLKADWMLESTVISQGYKQCKTL